MISICIPVYNRDISALLLELKQQIDLLPFEVELVVIDDASSRDAIEKNNESVAAAVGGKYIRLSANVGRTAIRFLFAAHTSHSYLLFIDNDCIPFSTNFLAKYAALAAPESVVCGGLKYRENPPSPEFLLHWKYGTEREVPAGKKNLLTSNFLLHKTILAQIPFPVLPESYGHEDSWIEAWLRGKGVQFKFIDNPVFHDGLKLGEVFLHHQKEAVVNLLFLYKKNNAYSEVLARQSPLLRSFRTAQKSGVLPLLSSVFKRSDATLTRKLLHGKDISLKWLDTYKLLYAASYWTGASWYMEDSN